MELFLIRHAESELNRDRTRIGGSSPWCELNDLGVEQSRALGRALAARDVLFDRIISSAAVRAQQTARYCFEEADVPLRRIEVSDEITEISMGEWEGEPRAIVYSPARVAVIERDAWNFEPPGGESQRACAERFDAWLRREVLGTGASRVAIVTHGLLLRCFLTKLFGWDVKGVLDVPVQNTSVHVLSHMDGKFELVRANDTSHLDAAGLSSLHGLVRPSQLVASEKVDGDAG